MQTCLPGEYGILNASTPALQAPVDGPLFEYEYVGGHCLKRLGITALSSSVHMNFVITASACKYSQTIIHFNATVL